MARAAAPILRGLRGETSTTSTRSHWSLVGTRGKPNAILGQIQRKRLDWRRDRGRRLHILTAITARDGVLEVEVGFDEEQLAVGILRIDCSDHALAPGVPVVEGRAEVGAEAVVGVEVPNIRQVLVPIAGAPLVAECRRLESASAGIPEV